MIEMNKQLKGMNETGSHCCICKVSSIQGINLITSKSANQYLLQHFLL